MSQGGALPHPLYKESSLARRLPLILLPETGTPGLFFLQP